MKFGRSPVAYYVPWHLLQATDWSTVAAGGQIDVPSMNSNTGHTLVNYLYTGTYQTLSSGTNDVEQQPQLQFEQALLVYKASLTHDLPGLEELAMQQIEEQSVHMNLRAVINTTRNNLKKKKSPDRRLQGFLEGRMRKDFEENFSVFEDDALCLGLCQENKLNGHVLRYMVALMTQKLHESVVEKKSMALRLDQQQTVPEEEVYADEPSPSVNKGHEELQTSTEEDMAHGSSEQDEAVGSTHTSNDDIDSNSSLDVAVAEKLVIPAETKSGCQTSVPDREPETIDGLSVHVLSSEPHLAAKIEKIPSGVQDTRREQSDLLDSVKPESYVPPPLSKKEIKMKKKRLAKEKRDRKAQEIERLQRTQQKEKGISCWETVQDSVVDRRTPSAVESNSS